MLARFSPSYLPGAAYGLAAAALFGISTPFVKLLLPESGPLLIAGLLYLGAGFGLLAFERLFPGGPGSFPREARVRISDRWLLSGIVLTGGILGPVCMLWGLQRLSAVLASLLLNLEAPLTILVAVVFLREHMGRLEIAAAMLVFVGAGVLAYRPEDTRADLLGLLAIMAACLCWAIDNNLTQRVSLRDPMTVTRVKALGAGACTLSLALIAGQTLPRLSILIATLVLGLISYGISLVLDTYALRLLGAARESGLFATAPFMGAVAAIPILGERWESREGLAAALMAAGVLLLLREHHVHEHAHEGLEHDHAHRHEEHHQHEHGAHGFVTEPHAHLHWHLPLTHDHPHVSEAHHRHDHG